MSSIRKQEWVPVVGLYAALALQTDTFRELLYREEMSADQRELFNNAQRGQGPPGVVPPGAEPAPAPVWLQRMSLIVLVIFCFYIGGLLTLLPWWGRYWQQNGWLMNHPALYNICQQGWMRGIVSGLGLIDIWIGVSEVVHYRDYRA